MALPAQPGGASSFGSGLSGLGNGVLSRASLGERLARQDSLIRGSNEIRARSGCAAQSDPTTVRPANAAAPQPVLQSVRPTGSAMIATPAMAETTGPTSNTMSTPGPGAGTSRPTLSHDGSNSLTNSDASSARNGPGAGASPHTGYSSGMTPSAGTGSGTADGTTDTGATSPGSGKSAVHR